MLKSKVITLKVTADDVATIAAALEHRMNNCRIRAMILEYIEAEKLMRSKPDGAKRVSAYADQIKSLIADLAKQTAAQANHPETEHAGKTLKSMIDRKAKL